MKLTEQKCEACEGGVIPFNATEANILLKQIPNWEIGKDIKSLSRHYTFSDFAAALKFINKVGEIAESEGHHPDLHLTDYKHVTVELSTHAIGGLSNNDFIVAAKIDQI